MRGGSEGGSEGGGVRGSEEGGVRGRSENEEDVPIDATHIWNCRWTS